MQDYYQLGEESDRLFAGIGRLERVRSQELLSRFLPPPPATIFDVGGGPGTYSAWLARAGYQVHLVDPILLHLQQARQRSDSQPIFPIRSIVMGDARWLGVPPASADAVLLLGPLYHLLEREDRITAIREARMGFRSVRASPGTPPPLWG